MQKHYRSLWSAGPTTLLPFLYNTRTIWTPVARCPKTPSRSNRKLSTRISSPSVKSYIPFEETSAEDKWDPDDSPKIRDSTITATERDAFERLFNALPKPSPDQQSITDDLFDEEHDGDLDMEATLESIFEAAIEKVNLTASRKRDENLARIVPRVAQSPLAFDTESFPPPLRKAAEQANDALLSRSKSDGRVALDRKLTEAGSLQEAPPVQQLTDYQLQVQEAREEDLVRVRDLLDSAQSDIEVWEILSKEVFSRVETMNQQTSDAEKKHKVARKPSRKTHTSNRKQKSSRAQAPLSSTSVSALSILQTNYALHCLRAMRLFRKHFPTSPYASALLPTIKRLGSVSYVLGASTALYNELLYIRWVHYTDLHGVASLVDEMIEQGIGVGYFTLSVLLDGARYFKRAKSGKLGRVAKGFTELQGVSEGMLRWEWAKRRVEWDLVLKKERKQNEKELEEEEEALAKVEAEERKEEMVASG